MPTFCGPMGLGDMSREELLKSFQANNHNLWSLVLAFEPLEDAQDSSNMSDESRHSSGTLNLPSSGQSDWAQSKPTQWARNVGQTEAGSGATAQGHCLFADAGFMAHHSRFIEGAIENHHLPAHGASSGGKERVLASPCPAGPIVIPVPRMCGISRACVNRALAMLYFPDRFKVTSSNVDETLHFADFFDVPALLSRCEHLMCDSLRFASKWGSPTRLIWFGDEEWRALMKALILSDTYRLGKCWAKCKRIILHSAEEVGRLVDQEDFKTLSVDGRLDIMEDCVRTHLSTHSHPWR